MNNFPYFRPVNKLLPAIAAFLLAGGLILGCQKENLTRNDQSDQEILFRGGGGSTVLGVKYTIPYKVEVMKQAYNNLYDPDISDLSPNYLYVRFLPQSPQDVGKLLESGIEFWDTPLDYEVVSWGESYIDPVMGDSAYTWQYAVVPAGSQLPAVQYEILEELALVPEDCHLAQQALYLTGNTYDVPDSFVADPSIVRNKFDFQIDSLGGDVGVTGGVNGGENCNCPLPDHIRKPSGCVQVFDNMLNGWEGVINVEVHTARTQVFGVVFHRKTETDANGCWMINHKYSGKIHIWVRWENSTVDVKTMNSDIDLWGYSFPRKAYIDKFNGPNFNDIPIQFNFTSTIDSWDFRNWAASSVNNSVFEFGEFLNGQGIDRPLPDNLKILITPWGAENTGASPMLDKMGFVQQSILYSPAMAILTGLLGVVLPEAIPLALPLAEWLKAVAPDIAINLNNATQVNSDDIREVAYHELSHALHFDQVGSTYWLDNIAYVLVHLGYGDGDEPGAGRCSVIESWGWQIGMIATHLRYGGNNSNSTTPMVDTWRAILEWDISWNVSPTGLPHIPYGWEWDIQDDNFANPPNENENWMVTDRVTGITNVQIFGVMTPNMLSMPQMKDALEPFLPPTIPLTTYDQLGAPYGL